jgi:hypothetical protein
LIDDDDTIESCNSFKSTFGSEVDNLTCGYNNKNRSNNSLKLSNDAIAAILIDDDDTIEFEIVQSDNTDTKDIDENSTVQELKKVVNDNEQFHYLKSLLNDQNVKDTEIAQFVKVFNAENPDFCASNHSSPML